jgi:hypothetical protein
MDEIKFRHFRSVEGKVVPRHGTSVFIGARRDKEHGWVWDTETIVRVPETEYTRYLREYRRALNEGALVECTKADFDKQEKALEKAAKDVAKATSRGGGSGEED